MHASEVHASEVHARRQHQTRPRHAPRQRQDVNASPPGDVRGRRVAQRGRRVRPERRTRHRDEQDRRRDERERRAGPRRYRPADAPVRGELKRRERSRDGDGERKVEKSQRAERRHLDAQRDNLERRPRGFAARPPDAPIDRVTVVTLVTVALVAVVRAFGPRRQRRRGRRERARVRRRQLRRRGRRPGARDEQRAPAGDVREERECERGGPVVRGGGRGFPALLLPAPLLGERDGRVPARRRRRLLPRGRRPDHGERDRRDEGRRQHQPLRRDVLRYGQEPIVVDHDVVKHRVVQRLQKVVGASHRALRERSQPQERVLAADAARGVAAPVGTPGGHPGGHPLAAHSHRHRVHGVGLERRVRPGGGSASQSEREPRDPAKIRRERSPADDRAERVEHVASSDASSPAVSRPGRRRIREDPGSRKPRELRELHGHVDEVLVGQRSVESDDVNRRDVGDGALGKLDDVRLLQGADASKRFERGG